MTETQEFETFMRNYQNMVFTTALRLVADAAEAEDISQDVFLKAFQHFADLRANPAAGGWLKRVATNLSLNHLSRYRSRWRFFSEFSSNRDDDAEAEPDFPAPQHIESDLDLADRHQLVEAALQKLPAAQRVPPRDTSMTHGVHDGVHDAPAGRPPLDAASTRSAGDDCGWCLRSAAAGGANVPRGWRAALPV